LSRFSPCSIGGEGAPTAQKAAYASADTVPARVDNAEDIRQRKGLPLALTRVLWWAARIGGVQRVAHPLCWSPFAASGTSPLFSICRPRVFAASGAAAPRTAGGDRGITRMRRCEKMGHYLQPTAALHTWARWRLGGWCVVGGVWCAVVGVLWSLEAAVALEKSEQQLSHHSSSSSSSAAAPCFHRASAAPSPP
jgi:hypothetical protein